MNSSAHSLCQLVWEFRINSLTIHAVKPLQVQTNMTRQILMMKPTQLSYFLVSGSVHYSIVSFINFQVLFLILFQCQFQ